MKPLFLILLLANVLLFGWYYRVPPPEPASLEPAVSDTATDATLSVLDTGPAKGARDQAAVLAGAAGSNAVCFSAGPFTAADEAAAAVETLEGLGLQVVQRRREEEFKVGKWVYLPPFDSREAAQETVAQLREQGISDVYVVASEDWRNAVALGLYSGDEGVRRRLEQLAALDVEASVRDRLRNRELFEVLAWTEDPDTVGALERGGNVPVVLSRMDCAALSRDAAAGPHHAGVPDAPTS